MRIGKTIKTRKYKISKLLIMSALAFLITSAINPRYVVEAIDTSNLLEQHNDIQNKLSLGSGYSAKIGSDKNLYTWGMNSFGGLGYVGNFIRVPTKVEGLTDIAAVSLGDVHTGVITETGDVYTAGYNAQGQLGTGNLTDSGTLKKVSGLSDVVALDLGTKSSAAITSDGSLYTWGYNNYGQAGIGNLIDQKLPVKIPTLSNVTAVSLGTLTSSAVTADGSLYTWGYNIYGQLGQGNTTNLSVPTKVPGLANVVAVATGEMATAAVTADGSLYTWGQDTYGQLGHGSSTNLNVPTKVAGLKNVVSVSLGKYDAAAVTTDGSLYTWGYNNVGQLGQGDLINLAVPTKVSALSNVVAVSLGEEHSSALTANGDLYTWGQDAYGQLGQGTTVNNKIPTKVENIPQATTPPPVIPPSTGSVQSHDVTAIFTGGDLLLTIPQINSFGLIKLESQAKIVTTSFDNIFNVVDSRGTDAGWRLDVSATRFTESTPATGFASGTSANKFPVGSLLLQPLSAITRVGSSIGILPTSKMSTSAIIDNGTVTVSGANVGEGSGEFNLAFNGNSLSLAVDPATAKVDKINYPSGDTPYSSTLTWTLVSGP